MRRPGRELEYWGGVGAALLSCRAVEMHVIVASDSHRSFRGGDASALLSITLPRTAHRQTSLNIVAT
jgi:hypothetical protein